jgi:CubicO group peptidase (beta-lactamase class C family)
MRQQDKHLYMSVSKGLAATLIAILEDRELIDVSKGVETYLPSLAGSGWEGVSVKNVLDMASGIGCLEGEEGAYSDPDTCYYQYEASLGWLRATEKTMDSTFEYMATLKSHRPPGEAFEYTSPNTFILGWLAESIFGKPYADLLSAEIWQKMGAESDGMIVAPRHGVPIASGGISSTLRDMARFGLLFTPSGRGGLHPLISDAYLDNIQHQGRPELFRAARDESAGFVDGEPARHNSYQWDFVMEDGDFFKGGYGGQGLYVSPSKDLVVAFFGTFDADGTGHEMTRIARQLAKSGLFDQ